MKRGGMLSFALALALALAVGSTHSVATEPENTAQVWADSFLRGAESNVGLIHLTSMLRMDGSNPVVVFKLTNVSGKVLKTYPFSLPWGNSNSVSLLVIRADKTFVQLGYPIDDPGPESMIEISPGATLTGEYNLGWRLQLTKADLGEDIIVLWMYRNAFGQTAQDEAFATGAVVIPRRRDAT